jgi:GntR family transcriptional regulator, rspAB operon transcriptional repressor
MKPLLPESSLAAEAYVYIRERIMRGEIAIGQVISRRKIAADLGMSFLPVSEAFLRLEFEGLLESRPRAGTRVRIPTKADVEGHYVVREGLEVQAARLFAERATLDARAEVLKLAQRVDSLAGQDETDRFVHLSVHEKLHRRIAELAECRILSEAIEKTCALSSTWLCSGRALAGNRVSNKHTTLVESLCSGDPDIAAAAMREHLITSKEWALERLAPYFELAEKQTQTYSRTMPVMLPTAQVSGESLPS